MTQTKYGYLKQWTNNIMYILWGKIKIFTESYWKIKIAFTYVATISLIEKTHLC